ncbi:hypothetical protein BaRGS_00003071 [Batillaria attramentaria]|uniref:Uncharacterized protein n=1 Tax=Batillaria attramentaria TaxID=370345 RepID=A0ABD0M2K6_9CAEN
MVIGDENSCTITGLSGLVLLWSVEEDRSRQLQEQRFARTLRRLGVGALRSRRENVTTLRHFRHPVRMPVKQRARRPSRATDGMAYDDACQQGSLWGDISITCLFNAPLIPAA